MKEKIRTFIILMAALFVNEKSGIAQIIEFELKEIRSYVGTRNNYGTTYNVYNYTSASNNISLSSGEKMTILDFYQRPSTSHQTSVNIEVQYSNSTSKFNVHSFYVNGTNSVPTAGTPVGKNFIGPCVISISLIGAGDLLIHPSNDINLPDYNPHCLFWRYEKTSYGTANSTSSSPTISTTAVVVPANATGDVDVLLEQSTDMITWTQCLPGAYNASTQKRFFRVRAVEK
jgi:hypothetical protein